MRPRGVECRCEAEVLAAVVEGRWPAAAEAGLSEHAAGCETCAEVALVAGAFEALREDGLKGTAAIPDAGRVWWMARMRARREAARAAGRPLIAAQAVGFVCAAGLSGWAVFNAGMAWTPGFLAAGLAAVVLMVPAAVYLVIRRD